jgi:hypothetical protein
MKTDLDAFLTPAFMESFPNEFLVGLPWWGRSWWLVAGGWWHGWGGARRGTPLPRWPPAAGQGHSHPALAALLPMRPGPGTGNSWRP